MPRREVRLLGDPVLRQRSTEVSEITSEIRSLVEDMFVTMYDEDGVGLAAPQVGIAQRVIVVDPHEEGTERFALINPRILESSEDTERAEEGCLSIPGVKEVVERSASIIAEGLTIDGTMRRIEASGLLARILLHEVDHLDGILFIDRISPLKRKLVLAKYQKSRAAK